MYTYITCARFDAFDEALDLRRRGDADRVSEHDLVRLELSAELRHVSGIDAPFEGTAERDADRHRRGQLGHAEDRHRLRHGLVERHVAVPLVERLGRRERAVHAAELRLAETLVALEVQDEPCVLGSVAWLDSRDDLLGSCHLRHTIVADEGRRVDARKTRGREPVDELGADAGRDNVGLVLQPVARADVAERDVHSASFADSRGRGSSPRSRAAARPAWRTGGSLRSRSRRTVRRRRPTHRGPARSPRCRPGPTSASVPSSCSTFMRPEKPLKTRRSSHTQPRATMRSIAPRARAAISGSTVTSNFQSRSDSSVIIFMYLQNALRLTGSKRLLGASFSRRWMIPISVATSMRGLGEAFERTHILSTEGMINFAKASTSMRGLGEAFAKLIIPSVERMCVRSLPNAIACDAQPHSGCTSSSASGASVCQRSMSSGRMPACTWHSPSQMFSLRPVTFSSHRPRYMSGKKRISWSRGIASMTAFALPDVQQ